MIQLSASYAHCETCDEGGSGLTGAPGVCTSIRVTNAKTVNATPPAAPSRTMGPCGGRSSIHGSTSNAASAPTTHDEAVNCTTSA